MKLVEGQAIEKTEMYQKLWQKIDACVKEPEMAVLDLLKRIVLHCSHTGLILQKITVSI
jgi:hypothetical protein